MWEILPEISPIGLCPNTAVGFSRYDEFINTIR